MEDEHMKVLLSTITQFDDMKGKQFALKKCNDISQRISSLQRRLGFAPGEPINAKNIHRIIPAAQNIDLILNKRRRSVTPMQKIHPGKVFTPQNHFLPGSSRIIPNKTNGVNCRFSTPTSTNNSVKKVTAHYDIVGAILKQGSSTAVPSRLSTPNIAKSSMVKVTATRNLQGRILEADSSQATNRTSRPAANKVPTGITYHLPAPNIKDSSSEKDKEHHPKNSDGDVMSSQESGVSVATVDSETCEEKENKIPDLTF